MWDKKLCCGLVKDKNISFCHPLPPVCHVPKTVLQIKYGKTEVVMSCPSFFSNQTNV